MAFAYNLHPGAIRYAHPSGVALAFGFKVDANGISLRGYKNTNPNADEWDFIRNPADNTQTSLFWQLWTGQFTFSSSVDPDGPLDPMPSESLTAVDVANKYGVDALIGEMVDDMNDLVEADLGHMPAEPEVPPTTQFQRSEDVQEALLGALANYHAVDGKLVRKAA